MHLFSTCYKQRFCFLPATILPPFSTFFIYMFKNTMNSHCKIDVNLDMIVTLWIFLITKYTAIFDRYFHSWKNEMFGKILSYIFTGISFELWEIRTRVFIVMNNSILVFSLHRSHRLRERDRERWKICCEVFRIGVSLEMERRTKDIVYTRLNNRFVQ